MVPHWLHWLSIASLALGISCAAVIAADVARRPQQMWIMNVVWPVVALFGHAITLFAYFRVGRLAAREKARPAMARGETPPHTSRTSFATKVGKGASHCGAGCTLGDICAEWLLVLAPAVATWFGYRTLFDTQIFAVWIVDYLFAFAFGVAFQFFTIRPMRDLSVAEGLKQAVKADVLSLSAWQIGMYGFMAVAHFWIFGALLGARLETATVEFWFMMQIAMLFGFATSYPVNWWLIRKGIKEAM